MKMNLNNDFNIEDIVYLKHDVDQKTRMVNAIIITKNDIMYELISGTEVSNHFGYEMSYSKKII